jgi:copper(I)-binding protein
MTSATGRRGQPQATAPVSRPGHGRLLALPVAGVLVIGLALVLLALRDRGGAAVAAPSGPRLAVSSAYVREPASPDVAAAYLTIANTGAAPDELLGVSSDVAAEASLHQQDRQGMADIMRPLASLRVPARGSVAFTPGGDHIMLTRPTALRPGQTVQLTLRFRVTGMVRVAAPVIAIGQPPPGPHGG